MSGSAPPALRSALLDGIAGLRHGFFTRRGGNSTGPFASLNAGEAVDDDPVTVAANRAAIASALAIAADRLALAVQVHGAAALWVDGWEPTFPERAEADALLSSTQDLAVAVKTADCVPMLVASRDGRAVAAVHGGWRGLAGGVIASTVRAFADQQILPASLHVAIGPHIGPCCYEVGEEVIAGLGKDAETRSGGRVHADLGRAALRRWLEAGVPGAQIEQVGPCVACAEREFFSHRRDRGRTGRQLAAIVPAG